MTRYDVYGLGNAIVDTEFQVTDEVVAACNVQKGVMTLIDEEQKHSLVAALSKLHEPVNRSGGGSAANTLVAVAQFGGTAYYSCRVANDATGDFFLSDLKAAGVETNLQDGRVSGVSGECLSLITPDAERTLTTCLGVSGDLGADVINESALARSRFLYLEGYLVSNDASRDALFRAQSIAQANGVPVSLTLSDPAMVENFREVFDELVARGVDLIFCNDEEAKLWVQADTRDDAVAAVRERCSTYAVTCGPDGAIVSHGGKPTPVPGSKATPVDTTGAGDMFAGAYLWALTRGQSHTAAAALANKAAATVVSHLGARLTPDVFAERLG